MKGHIDDLRCDIIAVQHIHDYKTHKMYPGLHLLHLNRIAVLGIRMWMFNCSVVPLNVASYSPNRFVPKNPLIACYGIIPSAPVIDIILIFILSSSSSYPHHPHSHHPRTIIGEFRTKKSFVVRIQGISSGWTVGLGHGRRRVVGAATSASGHWRGRSLGLPPGTSRSILVKSGGWNWLMLVALGWFGLQWIGLVWV